MTESRVINRWIEDAAAAARIEEARKNLVRLLQRRFPTAITEETLGTINAQPNLGKVHKWFDSAISAGSAEEFIAALRR
jgi:2-oxo-4-hydroxy-4-carboxy--5-ureidoimidazoline (OHCU) decarboxylase